MPRLPEIHPYSDRASFERIMLLISAIANKPGIAPQSAEVPPMQAILIEMQSIAKACEIEWQSWSENTIRKDIAVLRNYKVLPSGTSFRSGYYFGKDATPQEPPKKPCHPRKSKLNREEIVKLRQEGKSLAEVAEIAGISRERVRQIENSKKEQKQ